MEPYRLSFGTVKYFDSIFCCINTNSFSGIGECTPLYGYNTETNLTASNVIAQLGSAIINKTEGAAKKLINKQKVKYPFAASTLLTALDKKLQGAIYRKISFNLPLVGLISLDCQRRALFDLQKLLSQGYRVFKVKVGKNIDKESKIINLLLRNFPKGVYLKCDANKFFSFSASLKFVGKIKKLEKIEYIEQPFAAEEFSLNTKLQKISGVNIALDESIYSQSDVIRASKNKACKFIKLKLMKHGTLEEMKAICDEAQGVGMGVIIGNGMQTDWGCFLEGIIYKGLKLKTYGEMTGFLKQKKSLMPNLLKVKAGHLIYGHSKLSIEGIKKILKKRSLSHEEIY